MAKQYHTDGREIIRCRSLAGVKRAFAAGAIAHLISGSVTIKVNAGDVTLWVSDSATATMWAYGSAKATMWAYGSAKATMRAYGSAKAGMRASDSATATMRAYGSATATMRASDSATAGMWAYGSATAGMWASDSATADMWASDSATADMWASDSATATMRAYGSAKATMRAYGSAKADMRASDSATADMRAYGSATATMRAYGSAKAQMAWASTAQPDPYTAARLKYTVAQDEEAEANIREVAAFVKRERASFNMKSWHSQEADAEGRYPCGTTHCMAGAAIMLKGERGREMERLFGPELAGLMILGREAASYFNQTESDKPALDFLASKLGEPIE